MSRRPIFWVVLTIVALGCAGFAYWFFPRAFPIISIDITLTRDAALARALELAGQRGWGPGGAPRAVASFESDGEVQTFVEIEGGGPDTFAKLLDDPFYTPYAWRVRLFRESDNNETAIRFRPDGRPYGFKETIAENTERPNLDPDAARATAERSAREDFQIDPASYALIESGQDRKPNGRLDHTFVYERDSGLIGDGRHRLRIVVSGDRVSEVTPFVRVPEGFTRRYAEMRAANSGIALGGTAGAVLYLLAGCGIGLFFLARRQALLWRPAIVAAALIALAVMLASLNAWPLRWLGYDTALPAAGFVVQSLLSIGAIGIGLGAVMAFSFAAAEGLSRLAFPRHPRFWMIWRRDSAASPEIAGRTAAGYLLTPVMLAYVMVFYAVAGRLWGWWNPTDTLVNPDSLAHYAPWFTPFANALQAGVWEECLFRAVPLAGAALLGARFGRRTLFIALAFVLQIAVFGATHASYPTQPAYARLIELIAPSALFGFCYLRYGLLPAIVLHFSYDVTLMALPIFATEGSGIVFDRVMLVLLALAPALVIAARRMQAGTWVALPAGLRNSGWAQAPITVAAPEPPVPAERPAGRWPAWLIPSLAVFCILTLPVELWWQARARLDVPRLNVSRADAERIARATLAERGVEFATGTRVLISVLGAPGIEDVFVWRTAGRDGYETLIGNWIHPPRYLVRFARFEGEVAERAAEWIVTVTRDGIVRTVRHVVAEATPGADLDIAAARELAYAGIERELRIARSSVREISVEPKKQPARTDWVFQFADTTGTPLPRGERRVRVDIAGDEVIGVVQQIQVPEDWQRDERATANIRRIVSGIRALTIAGMLIAAVVAAIGAWSRRSFSVRWFLASSVAVLLLGVLIVGESWPTITARFSTAQPYQLQTSIALIGIGILVSIAAIAAALIVGMVVPWRRAWVDVDSGRLLAAGLLLGFAIRGLMGLTIPFAAAVPQWPPASTAMSFILHAAAPAVAALSQCLANSILLILVFGATDRFTAGWTRRRAPAVILLFLVGAVAFGSDAGVSWHAWSLSACLAGASLALGYSLLVRHDLAVVPVIAAGSSLLGAFPLFLEPYPGASLAGMLAAVLILGYSYVVFRVLRKY